MIEKLDKFDSTEASIYHAERLYTKVNQLVDAVNTIQKEREAERVEIQEWIDILEAVRKSVNIHEKQIDELQMKLEPEKCETPAENAQDRMIGCTTLDIPKSYKNDPYAEQRKWMWHLCRFWFDDKKQADIGVLGDIYEDSSRPYWNIDLGQNYKHCEPVKPDDDIIYKGK